MLAVNVKTEYLHDPMGIDIVQPRLFWNCEGGVTQTAYQILCRDEEGHTLWDSGKTPGNAMRAQYAGEALKSRSRVLWRVRLWDENDRPSDWSEEASFELGLLDPSDWQAKWITGNYKVNKKQRYPVDCFRKAFSAGTVKKARLYATACGVYVGRLNGKRIGDFILAPGITDYRRRVQVQSYDVTALLKNGENELSFQLADGWYRGSVGAWGLKNQYGTETKLLAQLELTMTDGTLQTISTDGSWAWSNDGPIRFADNKDGEIVDAARVPSYRGKAKETTHPVIPTASNNVAVTEHEHIKPEIITTPAGKTVLDFGQNIAGYAEFTLNAHQGQRVFLRFGEMLDEKGEFTQKNIQFSNKKITTPLQQVEYFCKEGENHYKTTFAIFGFQYVLVETDIPFRAEDFTAIAVYSDMAQTGFFESSNDLLNKFVESTVWSTKSNSLDLPTDCPTRERHGWTGDAQIFYNTASYLFDYATFGEKYIRDMYDWQRKDGCLPHIVPDGGADFYMYTMNGSIGWSDAGVLLPYRMWKRYGDDRVLARYYDGMKAYARFMMHRCGGFTLLRIPIFISHENQKYLANRGQSYGEWAEPADVRRFEIKDFVFPHPEESTAYTCYVMEHMEEIAEHLGKQDDAAQYRRYAGGCRRAYQELVEKKAFTLDTDRQAKLVRPLYMRLLDEKQTDYAEKRLLQAMEHYGWRLGTGFLSTPFILDVLADMDIEYAYRLLENEEMPGWLFMPKNRASTIWESWEGTQAQDGIASLNHYSKGAVCEWLFKTMCGIRVEGENHFTIAPRPGGHFTYAKASYDSVYGRVESGWTRESGKTVFEITVPANCTAELRLPGQEPCRLTAGTWRFER
ncbi:MAG: family 78 glycoside hydrolase catalytic domain [Candidatus Limivicinus sp.]